MEPAAIAAMLRELAVYYELDGDKHRTFAYDRAARSIEGAKGLHRLIDEGRLQELPGIARILGLTIALETGDAKRFADAGHFASYCRCVKSRLIRQVCVWTRGGRRV